MQKLGGFYTSDHKLLHFNLDTVKNIERITNIRYNYKRMNIKGA